MTLLFSYLCLFAIAIQNVTVFIEALKCRAENQQMDMQFEKVLQICKRRNSVSGSRDLNSGSTESSSSEDKSNFEEDIFSKKFLANNMNNQRDRNSQNRTNNSYNNNRGNVNRWNDERNMRATNNHQQQHSNAYSRTYDNRNNVFDKVDNNNYFNRDQACIIQCFFNEFNAVDHKGFPVKHSVIRLMKQDIQDIDLQDFIQESVEECFRYLQPVSVKDNCEFSQNLLNCLADKAKERCDDWAE